MFSLFRSTSDPHKKARAVVVVDDDDDARNARDGRTGLCSSRRDPDGKQQTFTGETHLSFLPNHHLFLPTWRVVFSFTRLAGRTEPNRAEPELNGCGRGRARLGTTGNAFVVVALARFRAVSSSSSSSSSSSVHASLPRHSDNVRRAGGRVVGADSPSV